MADATKLKQRSARGAEPPARPSNITSNPPRDKKPDQARLNFKLDDDVVERYSAVAAEEFGFTHGAKTKLFLKMFEFYEAHRKS